MTSIEQAALDEMTSKSSDYAGTPIIYRPYDAEIETFVRGAIWALDRTESIAVRVAMEFGTGAGQEAAYRIAERIRALREE